MHVDSYLQGHRENMCGFLSEHLFCCVGLLCVCVCVFVGMYVGKEIGGVGADILLPAMSPSLHHRHHQYLPPFTIHINISLSPSKPPSISPSLHHTHQYLPLSITESLAVYLREEDGQGGHGRSFLNLSSAAGPSTQACAKSD